VAPTTAQAKARDESKLDDLLRAAVTGGCAGTRSVIIRTKPGQRESVRRSLTAHGDHVKGEFPGIDALAVEVHCEDLLALVGLGATRSMSNNSPVWAHQLETVTQDPTAETASTEEPASETEEPASETDAVESSSEETLEAFGYDLSSTTVTTSFLSRLNEALAAQKLQTNLFGTLGVKQSLFNTLLSYSLPQVGVAVIDSGIEPGIDFGNRITAFYDFTNGDIRVAAPSDAYGHGTHVAGLIGSTFVGVAPTARLVGLKVLDGQGRGTTDSVLRAIEFAIINKDVLKIQVLNLSLGHPVYESAATDPLVQAVEHAVRAGLTVVVSAGNFGRDKATGQIGYAGVASPGNSPSAISVGSVRTFDSLTRDDDRIAAYSSRGPSWYDGFAKPDLSAPGDNLLSVAALGSTLRLAQERRGNVGNYMRLSGTSMAAGVATGMVVRVLQANHDLTPNALKMVLQYSSIPVKGDDGYADALTQGAGSIVGGALTLARAINPAAPVGSNWLVASVAPSSTIGDQTYVWAQRMIWGNHIARGAGVVEEQRPAWALQIVWGEGLEDDDNIVWGNILDIDDNIVWGNNLVWENSQEGDDNIVWGNLEDNTFWGNLDDDNIVWGNNIVWGDSLLGISLDDDNIVWGNNIVWDTLDDDNIVWGNLEDDNIVWGNSDDDNIVWGNTILLGKVVIYGSSKRGKGAIQKSLKKGVR
jgi:serine protease AprX